MELNIKNKKNRAWEEKYELIALGLQCFEKNIQKNSPLIGFL